MDNTINLYNHILIIFESVKPYVLGLSNPLDGNVLITHTHLSF